MNKVFIPELHDIGKLVDKDAIKDAVKSVLNKKLESHVFINFSDKDFEKLGIKQPTSTSWWGQYHHYKVAKQNIGEIDINQWNIRDTNSNQPSIEDKYHLFLLILSDHLASSVSRVLPDQLKTQYRPQDGIVKLWNKDYYNNLQKNEGKYWAAFRTIDDLKILFDVIENCQSGDQFLQEYEEKLLLTPEDKSIVKNITSLYSHLELTGKFYRVLEKRTKVVNEPNNTISIEYEGKKVKTITEAEGCDWWNIKMGNKITKGEWQAKLLKCWIKFPHSFVRLQDVNLLRIREQLINDLEKNYKNEVLFATSDFIALFLPASADAKQIFEPFLKWNFYIEVEETLADLGILDSVLDNKILEAKKQNEEKMLKALKDKNTRVRKIYLYTELSDDIEPPICDICQQRRGVERGDKKVKEWVCDKCKEIRDIGEPFREYATEWEEENVKVCWFKFSLDQGKLERWLQIAFDNHVMEYILKNPNINKSARNIALEEFRPLALQVDFNRDYKKMLEDFWKDFSKGEVSEDIKKPIKDYDELGVFKYSPELTKMVIEKYMTLIESYFPDCVKDEDCPISLSLSIANIKYPVREHWRFFEEENKSFLNVIYHRVFSDKYTKDEVKDIFEKIFNAKVSSSFLHKLLQIEERFHSDIYTSVEIYNNREQYPEIYELLLKNIRPSKFLNFYKVLRREEV